MCQKSSWNLKFNILLLHFNQSQLLKDLMSMLFTGPENTPYEDGVFAFDVQLPGDYPTSPPRFHYVSYSHRLNPNLYEDGKVCVSLLGTWMGKVKRSERNSFLALVIRKN